MILTRLLLMHQTDFFNILFFVKRSVSQYYHLNNLFFDKLNINIVTKYKVNITRLLEQNTPFW